jgi:cytochrome c-type biogenesis protein CcmH/NrfF
VCCAGPIFGFLAAIGLGTAVGAVLWGSIAVIIGALVVVFVVVRRRRRTTACATTPATESSVELTTTRNRQ